ncbi:MAG: hypothetical protein ACXQS3_06680 [Candidatus Methanofastidiosia archaeon]
MNKLQYGGILASCAGMLLFLIWTILKTSEYINLPTTIQVAFLFFVGGIVIVLASLIYERSKDVKEEKFPK